MSWQTLCQIGQVLSLEVRIILHNGHECFIDLRNDLLSPQVGSFGIANKCHFCLSGASHFVVRDLLAFTSKIEVRGASAPSMKVCIFASSLSSDLVTLESSVLRYESKCGVLVATTLGSGYFPCV